MDYCCYYCPEIRQHAYEVIGHTVVEHGDRFLSIKKKTTERGKTGYVSQHFHIIPDVLKTLNKSIWITPEGADIRILDYDGNKIQDTIDETISLGMQTEQRMDDYLVEPIARYDEKCINLETILNLIPNIENQRQNFRTFLKLIYEKRFPMQNISFLLFLDVVRWYSEPNLSSMRYGSITKSFWHIGYRLFHTKFLNFMRGLGNQTLVRDNIEKRGHLCAQNSKLNFAVPSKLSLSTAPSIIPKLVHPGIITDLIAFVSKTENAENKSWKICVDLKKINAGKEGQSSPVDLWGYEEKPTKKEKETEYKTDMEILRNLKSKIECLLNLGYDSLQQVRENESQSHELKENIMDIFNILCKRLKVLRLYLVGKERNLDSLMKKAEKEDTNDWKKSKFVYVISAVKTNISAIKDCIDRLLNSINKLCFYCSFLNNADHNFVFGTQVNMNNQGNFYCLIDSPIANDKHIQERTRFIQQRSEEWFKLRKEAKVTASTLHTALGLKTLKEQQAHYDAVSLRKETVQKEPTVQMIHGTTNEKNAVATICGKILPSILPTIKFKEVGCYVLWKDEKPFIVASPDGEGDEGQMKRFLFEIKCPYKSDWKASVHYTVPEYYILQLVSQMGTSKECYGYYITKSLFVSWSEESTTAFLVEFDEEFWKAIKKEVEFLYGGHNSRRPTKRRPETTFIKSQIVKFLDEHVTYLGEFKSLKGIPCSHTIQSDSIYGSHLRDICDNDFVDVETLFEVKRSTEEAERVIQQHYLLCKDRPSDVIVFMLSDLDRTFTVDNPYVFPVAYGFSPKHLKAETVRGMLQFLREYLKTFNIDVQVEAFDGQFSRLAVTSSDGKALTELHERKTFWKDVCNLSTSDLLRPFIQLGKEHGPLKTFEDVKKAMKITIEYKKDKDGNLVHGPITCDEALHSCYVETCTSTAINLWREAFSMKSRKVTKNDSTPHNADNVCNTPELIKETGPTVSISEEVHNEQNYILTDKDYQTMLEYLIRNATMKRQAKWKLTDLVDFKKNYSSADAINRHFTKDELQGCLKVCTQNITQLSLLHGVSSKSNKCSYTDFFAKVSGCSAQVPPRVKKCSPKSLKTIMYEKFKSVRKEILNEVTAFNKWPTKYEKWKLKNCSPVTIQNITQMGFDTKHDWFTTPDKTDNGNIFLRFLDHHHLLTNCRIHCCRNGFKAINITPMAWFKVAKKSKINGTGLNIAYVEDLIDPQSNLVAQLTFSKKVEDEMRKNNDISEANFCKLIREWYDAVDEKGLSANDRTLKLLSLREFLLDSCQSALEQFPPPGSHICDIPIVLFIGLITSCERLIQLYRVSKSGTYNVRSIGSLDNETFFSSFRDLDPRGAGVLKTSEIPKAMSVACEILTTKMNPDRGYYFKTTTKLPVYNEESMEKNDTNEMSADQSHDEGFRNHPVFDFPRKTTAKRKSATVNSYDNCAHGAQGIRQYHRKDEEKILPHKRACLDID